MGIGFTTGAEAFARVVARVIGVGAALLGTTLTGAATLPQVGPVDADFAPVDQVAQDYLAQYNMPGVTVVVAYGERIIYAQGYGYADRASATPTSPWLEYRLASVSKALTATAVMKLYEQGKLQLDAPAWGYVSTFLGGEPKDARLKQVTVRQLLTHTWGLNRAVSSDPMGAWLTDAAGKVLTTCPDVLRQRLLTMTLDFAPGSRYAYNNTGFCWLGLIAETLDGRPLDKQLSAMLGPEPLSAGRVRIGETTPAAITGAEPTYHDWVGAPQVAPVPGVYPAPAPSLVPRPYGYFTPRGYGGSGGLVASAFTLTRWIQRLAGVREPALLSAATRATMFTEQTIPDGTRYEGLGITVQRYSAPYLSTDYSIGATGSIVGTRTAWIATPRRPGGPMLTVVALLNGSRTGSGSGTEDDVSAELLTPLVFAVDKVRGYTTKAEIAGDRLIAPGSPADVYYTDVLFDWGQRLYPGLFPTPQTTGVLLGYRYRYYPETNTYLGTKDGRIWLYQPSVSGAIHDIASMVDYLPLALRDTDALKASAPRPPRR